VRLSFTMHSGKYTTFARHAFAQQVGKTVNLSWEGNLSDEKGTGRLVDAVVSNDGTKVDLVVEVSDAFLPGLRAW
jgi:hypothetical protein